MTEHVWYVCPYCTSEYRSPSAAIACEIRCETDRGRE